MDKKAREMIRDRLTSIINERFPNKTEGCEFLIEECDFDFQPAALRAKLRGSQTMRLREFLKIADAMNVDYLWLFTGARDGWENVPSDRVIVGLGEYGTVEFDVPQGWDPDVRFRPGQEPLAVSTEREEG